MALNAVQVRNAKPGRHADGKGLYLLVKPKRNDKTGAIESGAKSWVLRVQVGGRRRDFGLGSLDVVSLEEARDKARENRRLAKSGLDPAAERKKALRLIPTFKDAAVQYHEAVKRSWRNGKHVDQWLSTLKAHAFPTDWRHARRSHRCADDPIGAPAYLAEPAGDGATCPSADRVGSRLRSWAGVAGNRDASQRGQLAHEAHQTAPAGRRFCRNALRGPSPLQ